ncbi:nucleotidyltransferase domain-containing protein [Roseomonas sp. CCTCC AB2023176]|uniref:nucleotidyltransferase domain-containing protein n=1 Tax=Roseomonas sp. CCTCC AB2023176 TaxID=3342640 RepID=UPI0035E02D6B
MIAAVSGVEKIWVFGSRAVGDHSSRSDVDLAVSAPSLTRLELISIRDRAGQAQTLYKVGISLLEGMPQALRDRVLQLGSLIYERSEAC